MARRDLAASGSAGPCPANPYPASRNACGAGGRYHWGLIPVTVPIHA